jgi:hypothetical protein
MDAIDVRETTVFGREHNPVPIDREARRIFDLTMPHQSALILSVGVCNEQTDIGNRKAVE